MGTHIVRPGYEDVARGFSRGRSFAHFSSLPVCADGGKLLAETCVGTEDSWNQ
jgi:hypothetical protein